MMTRIFWVSVCVLLLAGAVMGQETQAIESVSPESAPPGTSNLLVTFTLPNSTPPTPPAGILPDSAAIGSISGSSLTHSNLPTVTAIFNIPAGESEGTRDCVVVFTTPNGQVSFEKAGGFTVARRSTTDFTARASPSAASARAFVSLSRKIGASSAQWLGTATNGKISTSGVRPLRGCTAAWM